ncbi:hypothetical protein [Mesomycoplasma hyopneumoniae]|uniref:hypothetical protein n=1 Tax=Mesomycoplasma hyopneumoniae TaxID=2099 RepID=UPI001083B970|nr:hypothetical protein [Mesomycoplasma hyopneumoniae]QBY87890.1 hypothetical protein E5E95_03420 [Mesomycoplasma hyopneumoniae]
MNKKSKNLLKKVCKIFLFAAFSTLIITSYTNNSFQDKTSSSQKITENLSKKSQEINKISQMAAVNELEDEEISKAILEIKPREDGFLPAIPLLLGGFSGILFSGLFANWFSQNPLPELPRIGGRQSYSPQFTETSSENNKKQPLPKKPEKTFENNPWFGPTKISKNQKLIPNNWLQNDQNSSENQNWLSAFSNPKSEKHQKSGPVYGPFLPGQDKRELNPIITRTPNSVTIDLNILAIKTKTKLSDKVATLSRVKFVEITNKDELKKYNDIHLAYFFPSIGNYKAKFIISETKISQQAAWALSVFSLQESMGLPIILEEIFFPNLESNSSIVVDKVKRLLSFKSDFYSYNKTKMQQLAYKVASTINIIIGAKFAYNVPYLNDDNDENYPKGYLVKENFIDKPFDIEENWYQNMPSDETWYLNGKGIIKKREEEIKKKVEEKEIFFKNYHVRRARLHPKIKDEKALKGEKIKFEKLKRVEGIHYLYGEPVKFPY